MLKQIYIENFKCLEKTTIKGFSNINLIGGKNNIGKTALLEALLIYSMPQTDAISQLKSLRQESKDFIKQMRNKTVWDNFFFQPKNSILLKGEDEQNIPKQVEIKILDTQSISPNITAEYYSKWVEILSQDGGRVYPLEIQVNLNNQPLKPSFIIDTTTAVSLQLNAEIQSLPFLPSYERISYEKLTQLYDESRLNELDHEVLNILKIVDSSIESIESFAIGEPNLFVRHKNQSRLPLSLFGDAVNRAAMIILKLINNKQNILLIDEIENGIHYTAQKELWRTLFRLSLLLNVQIFATTHSLEMIKSFAEVGLENEKNQNISVYFELTKHFKSQQIIGIKRDLDTLDYAIEHSKGVRGE